LQISQQVQDLAGKILQNQESQQSNSILYRETIIAKLDGEERPTHLKRQYDKAQRHIGNQVMTLPFQGQTYDIEKKGGRYHFQLANGQALPPGAVQALDQEFNSGW